MAEKNPVQGFSIVKEKKYKNDCKPYKSKMKKILKTELNIVRYPEKNSLLHGPLSGKCKRLLHARVDQNLRILYKPDYEYKIIFLTDLLPHREMEKKCG